MAASVTVRQKAAMRRDINDIKLETNIKRQHAIRMHGVGILIFRLIMHAMAAAFFYLYFRVFQKLHYFHHDELNFKTVDFVNKSSQIRDIISYLSNSHKQCWQ